MDTKLEVVVLPVSDVDRAKRFYGSLGWRLDADFATGEDWRLVQMTPPGSQCSVMFGKGFTTAVPGSVQGTFLVVDDIVAARAELIGHGVDVSEVFHFEGPLRAVGTKGRAPGKDPPPGAPVPPIVGPQDGFLALDKARFAASFAADLPAETAAFMADAQVPWGVAALGGAISEPAWKTKPSFYLVATDDRMIPPDAQRQMSKRAGSTAVEVKASHSVFASQPQAVASLIERAAKGLKLGAAK